MSAIRRAVGAMVSLVAALARHAPGVSGACGPGRLLPAHKALEVAKQGGGVGWDGRGRDIEENVCVVAQ